MAKYKNVSGGDLIVPTLTGSRLVVAGAVLDDTEVGGHLNQPGVWEPADDEAQASWDAAHAVEEALAEDAQPAGNASREVWAGYVLAAGLASEDEIEDMGRDDLRDTYGTTTED